MPTHNSKHLTLSNDYRDEEIIDYEDALDIFRDKNMQKMALQNFSASQSNDIIEIYNAFRMQDYSIIRLTQHKQKGGSVQVSLCGLSKVLKQYNILAEEKDRLVAANKLQPELLCMSYKTQHYLNKNWKGHINTEFYFELLDQAYKFLGNGAICDSPKARDSADTSILNETKDEFSFLTNCDKIEYLQILPPPTFSSQDDIGSIENGSNFSTPTGSNRDRSDRMLSSVGISSQYMDFSNQSFKPRVLTSRKMCECAIF